MSTETLKQLESKKISPKKIDIVVLKNRITTKIKKEKFHNRIIIFTFIASIGIIGYFVG